MDDLKDEEPLPLSQLQARYPYQFFEPELGVSLAKGWARRFSRLCREIDEALGQDKQGFHWIQVKEKFGSPRFYFRFGSRQADLRLDLHLGGGVYSQVVPQDDPQESASARGDEARLEEVRNQIRGLALQAEVDCKSVCLACGKPGQPDVSGGYVLVLCPEHIALRRHIEENDLSQQLIDWESIQKESL